ncbi:hypothetical protein D9602_02880 [Sphingomonas sp. TX0522]|nr:hypothetical protein [Sphingomonas sp. TX0522]
MFNLRPLWKSAEEKSAKREIDMSARLATPASEICSAGACASDRSAGREAATGPASAEGLL